MYRNITLVISSIIFISISYYTFDNSSNRYDVELINPYKMVDWKTFQQHKAALHVHTLQSDGYHMVSEVIDAYKEGGFTILALTDHDKMEPNAQFTRGRIDWLTFDEVGTPFPRDPKPYNYPFNTTWPWTDYGGS